MTLDNLPSQHAVRAAIVDRLKHDTLSLRCIADQFGMSTRSLQRHLVKTGSSYSKIVSNLRVGMACRLLIETDDRISDIATRLGYSGASGFSRTFLRTMKIQPIIYRRQNRAGKMPHGNGLAGSADPEQQGLAADGEIDRCFGVKRSGDNRGH